MIGTRTRDKKLKQGNSFFGDKEFVWFVAKFLLLFVLFYYGTRAVIGLAAPGDLYSPFVAKYLDYVSWIKYSLMAGTAFMIKLMGYATHYEPEFVVRIIRGAAVKIEMSCVGYGVYSFWAAYVIANKGNWKNKLKWVLIGLLSLWTINVLRISFFLWTIQNNKPMPLGIDHHTWFNILAYIFIFGMIWVFERGKGHS
jgi:exosortase/archaeosortase family protein